MRKRTSVAVVIAALLLGVVGPTVTTPERRQVAKASALNLRAVFRSLDDIIPRSGWTRTGRPAHLTDQQRWQLANVACTVHQVHDNVHEYESEADYLLSQLGWVNPYRFQSPVLELSRRIYQFKQDGEVVYEAGTQVFCDQAKQNVKLYAAAR
jgi:hypothetical protein